LLAIAISLGLFYNEFLIMPGSARYLLSSAQLYAPVAEQFNQNVYMFVTLTCLVVLTCFFGSMDHQALADVAKRMFYTGSVFALSVGFWQILSVKFGIPFPSAFFHSSGTVLAWQQELHGVTRISGSFSEPSALAGYFTPVLFFLGTLSALTGSLPAGILTVSCALLMVMSTSTTSFAVVPLFFVYYLALLLSNLVFLRAGPRINVTAILVVAAAISVLAVTYVLNHYDYYRDLIHYSLNKRYSLSYAMRSASNELATDIFFRTGGIGIGLGAHRASGLLYSILTAYGVVGIVCFGAFFLLHVRRAMVLSQVHPPVRAVVAALTMSGLSSFMAAANAAGEITSFMYYLPFSLLAGFWIARRTETEDRSIVNAVTTEGEFDTSLRRRAVGRGGRFAPGRS
jgi:hypothetical protein